MPKTAAPERGIAARGRPQRAGGAVRFGAALLLVLVGGCLLAVPWSFGEVGDGSGVAGPRYATGNLELNLLPPAWLGAVDAAEAKDIAARLEAAREAGRYLPGRLLGTDRLGRDVFARLLAGGVVSLAVGFFAAAIAVLAGTLYGAFSAFAGGRTDAVLMRIVDVLFGLPSILLVVLLAVAVDGAVSRAGWDLGPTARQWIGLATLFVAIGGVGWLTLARIVRGQVLSLRSRPFMEACEALGVPRRRRFLRHVLPNLAGPVLVYAALAVPAAMLAESFLSFLGIGVQEPLPSWGNLASEGLQELNPFRSRWWLLAAPCVVLSATLLALNLVGDHVRRGFDPGSGTP